MRRQQLLDAVPQWYENAASAYAIADTAWSRHPGVGYGSGTARAMLDRLAKDGLVERVLQPTPHMPASYKTYNYRLVNDGTVPEPPPPPKPPRESRRLEWVRERDVIDHFRYGLTADNPGQMRWHMEQIAAALGLDLDFDYEHGVPPSG